MVAYTLSSLEEVYTKSLKLQTSSTTMEGAFIYDAGTCTISGKRSVRAVLSRPVQAEKQGALLLYSPVCVLGPVGREDLEERHHCKWRQLARCDCVSGRQLCEVEATRKRFFPLSGRVKLR